MSFRGYSWIAIILGCALFWFFAPQLAVFIWKGVLSDAMRRALGLWVMGFLCICVAQRLRGGRLANGFGYGGVTLAGAGVAILALHILGLSS